MQRHVARGEPAPWGWENRSEAFAKGFIQVGRAVEMTPKRSEGAYIFFGVLTIKARHGSVKIL